MDYLKDRAATGSSHQYTQTGPDIRAEIKGPRGFLRQRTRVANRRVIWGYAARIGQRVI